jgi:hypothetical protein
LSTLMIDCHGITWSPKCKIDSSERADRDFTAGVHIIIARAIIWLNGVNHMSSDADASFDC